MSEEEETPIVNPNAEVETENPEEQPIPLHEDSEPMETQPEVEEASEERPEWFPAKFWGEEGADNEKLAKSYTELEKKFKAGKHKAPEEYDVSNLIDQGLDNEDPSLNIYTEWAKENGVSQAAFEDLANKVFEISKQEEEKIAYDKNQEMAKLGERGQEKIQMAERILQKAPLSVAEREAIAFSLTSADSINAFVKLHQSITNENIPITPVVEAQQLSKEDLQAAIADPRWNTDQNFRQKYEKQWFSNPS